MAQDANANVAPTAPEMSQSGGKFTIASRIAPGMLPNATPMALQLSAIKTINKTTRTRSAKIKPMPTPFPTIRGNFRLSFFIPILLSLGWYLPRDFSLNYIYYTTKYPKKQVLAVFENIYTKNKNFLKSYKK